MQEIVRVDRHGSAKGDGVTWERFIQEGLGRALVVNIPMVFKQAPSIDFANALIEVTKVIGELQVEKRKLLATFSSAGARASSKQRVLEKKEEKSKKQVEEFRTDCGEGKKERERRLGFRMLVSLAMSMLVSVLDRF